MAKFNNTKDTYTRDNSQDERNELDNLECTLSAIAKEIQKVSLNMDKNNFISPENTCQGDSLYETSTIKSSLKAKNKQIKKLTDDLKLACEVAKSVLTTKEAEAEALTNHLNNMKKTTEDLNKINKEYLEENKTVKNENQKLHSQLEKYTNIIKIGNTELRKMQGNQSEENIPELLQLKQIIHSCGQYYADLCNEKITHEQKVSQIEYKNRFLSNKVNILQNQFDAINEEVINLRRQNQRLNNEIGISNKNTTNKRDFSNHNLNENMKEDFDEIRVLNKSGNSRKKDNLLPTSSRLDLSTHFSLVRDLLIKQNKTLDGLKEISEEFKFMESF